jgi:hypothetical protein
MYLELLNNSSPDYGFPLPGSSSNSNPAPFFYILIRTANVRIRMRLRILCFVLLLASFAYAQQPQPRRIVRPVSDAEIVRLPGTMHPRIVNATDKGAVSPSMPLQRMMMVFSPSSEQQAALNQLLIEQQDPGSPNYHKWLTPEEFADRFGLAQSDIDQISAWLTAQGFTVDEVARGRNWIAFSGIAAQVAAAFRAPIHNYIVNGKTHFAASADISVPAAFSGVVSGVTGLHDFSPQPRNVTPHPRLTSSISGNHFMVPGDFATIYSLPSYTNGVPCTGVTTPCLDGTGQSIAIMGQTDLSTDSNPGRNGTPGANGQQYDIVTFRNLAGLPAVNLQIVVNGTDPGLQTSDVDEANLDVEWSGAIAPNAKLIYVISSPSNGGQGAFDSLVYAVNHNLAPVLSISYGTCEATLDSTTQTRLTNAGIQANAQGQAIVAPSGDNGAADCDNTLPATHGLSADFPGSMPYATSIGGTAFTGDTTNTVDPTQPTQYWAGSTNDVSGSAFSYIPETAWNDSSGQTTGPSGATGGGASVKFTKPAWQVAPGVPGDGARDVPDISFNASASQDTTVICSQSSCVNNYRQADTTFNLLGGTSVGTPQFAGILALINQAKGSAQGNPNPALYQVANNSYLSGTTTSWAYNDITTGDNMVACSGGTGCNNGSLGYSAGPGYDLVTGLGSIDVASLIDALTNNINPHFLLLPAARNVSMATGSPSVVNVLVTPKEGFSSAVALTCTPSSALAAAGVTCSYDNANVTAGGSANLTIQSGSAQATGTVTLNGVSGGVSNSIPINVSVGVQDFTVTSGNASETVNQGSSTTDTITISPVLGFAGSVSLSCTGSAGLTCSLNPSSVTVGSSPVTSTLTVTASNSAATGTVSITATSGALTHNHIIAVTVNPASGDFTLTVASPVVSIPSGGTITDNLTVAAVGGFSSDVALSCSVPSSLGTTTCTITPATVTGGSGSALVTLKGATLSRDRGAPFPFRQGGIGTYATFVFAFGGVFFATPSRRKLSRRAVRGLFLTLALLLLMFGLISCGGGNNGGGGGGVTPITGNVTITGTAGSITHTVTINVTVQ